MPLYPHCLDVVCLERDKALSPSTAPVPPEQSPGPAQHQGSSTETGLLGKVIKSCGRYQTGSASCAGAVSAPKDLSVCAFFPPLLSLEKIRLKINYLFLKFHKILFQENVILGSWVPQALMKLHIVILKILYWSFRKTSFILLNVNLQMKIAHYQNLEFMCLCLQ